MINFSKLKSTQENITFLHNFYFSILNFDNNIYSLSAFSFKKSYISIYV